MSSLLLPVGCIALAALGWGRVGLALGRMTGRPLAAWATIGAWICVQSGMTILRSGEDAFFWIVGAAGLAAWIFAVPFATGLSADPPEVADPQNDKWYLLFGMTVLIASAAVLLLA